MFHYQYVKVREDGIPVCTFVFKSDYKDAHDCGRITITNNGESCDVMIAEGTPADEWAFIERVAGDLDHLLIEIDNNVREYFQGASGCLHVDPEHGQYVFGSDITDLDSTHFS